MSNSIPVKKLRVGFFLSHLACCQKLNVSNSVRLFQAIVGDNLPCACIWLLNMTHSCWFTILCIMSIFHFPDYCINNLILKTQTVFCFILPCLRLVQDKTKRFPSYNNLSQRNANDKIDKFSVSQIVISL